MKRHSFCRYTLLLITLLLSISLSACRKDTGRPATNHTQSSTVPTVTPPLPEAKSDTDSSLYSETRDNAADISSIPETLTATPIPDKSPVKAGEKLKVHKTAVYLGESKDSIIKKLGNPKRIDDTEYDFNYYIYNNDFTHLLFIAVAKNKVVGFYTDSLDFSYHGISSGSGIQTVNSALQSSFPVKSVLTWKNGGYTVKVFMDSIDTQKVTGISVLPSHLKHNKYTETVTDNIALEVFDLTNSIRARNHADLLSWSSSAAISASKHSMEMAKNDYFSHDSLNGCNPSERLMEEGIYLNTCSENIIAGYGSAILSTHAWFSSSSHRKTMLNRKISYMGAGCAYDSHSTYKTYITQDFYN